MKKVILLLSLIMTPAFIFYSCEKAPIKESVTNQENGSLKSQGCATIKSGTIRAFNGDIIIQGSDQWGYNYQAHIFNGLACNTNRAGGDCIFNTEQLLMKWNDAWVSNKDCDGDHLLDQHYGFASFKGSGAWLTNHFWGNYYDENGNPCELDYFVKLIAVPADAILIEGFWFNADGTLIGSQAYEDFAVIQHILNDPCGGFEGPLFVSPDHAGLGGW